MAGQSEPNEKSILAKLSLLIIPFPLIFCLLYFGDLQTSHRKEAKLMQAAKHIIDDNKNSIDVLANYSFNSSFIKRSEEILRVISKEDENFPNISLIVSDTIDDKKVFLNFDSSNYIPENDEPRKSSFIYTSSKEERQYLQSVFSDGVTKTRFSASDGSYEMYVPVKRSNNTIVLYFSEYARYGKLGS